MRINLRGALVNIATLDTTLLTFNTEEVRVAFPLFRVQLGGSPSGLPQVDDYRHRAIYCGMNDVVTVYLPILTLIYTLCPLVLPEYMAQLAKPLASVTPMHEELVVL